MVRILLTGATGYLGSTLLTALLEHPRASTFSITALVRSEVKAAKIDALKLPGVRVVIGSHSDLAVVTPLAEQADVVFAAADCDDVAAANAILAGLKKQHETTGAVPVLIHTSGTAVVGHLDSGAAPKFEPYSDTDLARLATIPATAPHRNVDLVVIAADGAGYVRTHIILPSTVYGRASNPLERAGISHGKSQQIPGLVGTAIARGRVGVIGAGQNVWPSVHVEDLVQMYIILFDAALSDVHPGHGEAGYYFAASDEYKFQEVSEVIGRALVDQGLIASPVPTPFNRKDFDKLFAPYGGQPVAEIGFGSNCRVRSDRAFALGWKPTRTNEDLLASLTPEVEFFIADLRREKGALVFGLIRMYLRARALLHSV